ncbi:MAG: hypothetical protein HFF11_04620 [Angelakisella sp.]|jgi:hypothetical protein|nr:hypothetical protein [Angelakisella sp.]
MPILIAIMNTRSFLLFGGQCPSEVYFTLFLKKSQALFDKDFTRILLRLPKNLPFLGNTPFFRRFQAPAQILCPRRQGETNTDGSSQGNQRRKTAPPVFMKNIGKQSLSGLKGAVFHIMKEQERFPGKDCFWVK